MSPKFAESAVQEKNVDAKLTKMKLGKVIDVMKTPRISQLLEIARGVTAKKLYRQRSDDVTTPRGYNQLLPLDELMLKVGSYVADYGTFEHKSSIKSLVYGISESHLSEGRKSPRMSNKEGS